MSTPVALITGAASGIGLALTNHLLSKSYRVIMADLPSSAGHHLATTLGSSAIFLPTDVSSWSSQLELFKQAYEWSGGRLDVLFSNAGVADVDNLAAVDLQEDVNREGELKCPDLRPLDVNLVGTIYAVMLFKNFVKKSGRDGGKVVITASGAGQYGMPSHPVYCASKHGVSNVAITRRKFTKASSSLDLLALSVQPTRNSTIYQ